MLSVMGKMSILVELCNHIEELVSTLGTLLVQSLPYQLVMTVRGDKRQTANIPWGLGIGL